jgi:hypothetical protein
MNIQNVAFKKAITILNAIGANYYIVFGDETHGNLEQFANSASKRKHGQYPFGSITKHFKQVIGNIEVGDVREVPFNEFKPNKLQSVISSWACTKWGSGAVTTTINHYKEVIEVLRIK